MGSGASAGTQGGSYSQVKRNNKEIEIRYGIKAEKIVEKNGIYYCNLERDEVKLSTEILSAMERYNNFSKDVDDVPANKTKTTKSATKIKN
jgi:hypothetical protein